MRVKTRQFLVTVTLATPLVVAIAVAPPFSAEPRAQGAAHMLGPNFPVKVDMNGDGLPSAGDDNVVPRRTSGRVEIPTRWQACGNEVDSILELSNRDASGRFRTVTKTNHQLVQSVTSGNFVNGSPRAFSYEQTRLGTTTSSGSINLVDRNNDGVPDGASFTGTLNASISFVFAGNNDYISVPWSQVSAMGVDTRNSCAGALPQVWIPLADTNGDGRGDAIVFDLDGNGQADSDIFTSPTVAVPSVPTMGPIARLMLMALIGLVGAWFLSRRPTTNTGSPAALA